MSSRNVLACPHCNEALSANLDDAPQATNFDKCLRRCDDCGVAFSNAKKNPTRIYREPARNLPPNVRDGLEEALGLALNERNRGPKWGRTRASWRAGQHRHGKERRRTTP